MEIDHVCLLTCILLMQPGEIKQGGSSQLAYMVAAGGSTLATMASNIFPKLRISRVFFA